MRGVHRVGGKNAEGMKQPARLAVFAWLLCLAAFGCVLRFWKLTNVGLWFDELWTVVGASEPSFSRVYDAWLLGDSHPPGFTTLYWLYFKIVPNDELGSRLPCALSGVANVAYVLWGARNIFTKEERVFGAAFFSLTHAGILYANTCKQYAPMMLLITVLLATALKVMQERVLSLRTGATLWALCVSLAYLNYFATLLAGLVLGGLLLLPVRRRVLVVSAAVVVTCLPMLPFYDFMFRYSPGGSLENTFDAVVRELPKWLLFNESYAVWALAMLLMTIAFGVARDFEARARLFTRRNAVLIAIGFGLGGVFLVLGALKPVMHVRHFLTVFPPLLTVLASGCAAVCFDARGKPRALVVVPLVVLTAAGVVDARFIGSLRRQEWDKSVDLVLSRSKPDDVVLVLGWEPVMTSFEYLKAGDIDGRFYVYNLEFYRYYFLQKHAPERAAALEAVRPANAKQVLDRFSGSGKTVWVLGGHHTRFPDADVEMLRSSTRELEFTQLLSTRVYRLQF